MPKKKKKKKLNKHSPCKPHVHTCPVWTNGRTTPAGNQQKYSRILSQAIVRLILFLNLIRRGGSVQAPELVGLGGTVLWIRIVRMVPDNGASRVVDTPLVPLGVLICIDAIHSPVRNTVEEGAA